MKELLNKSGQIAVILIFFIAVLLAVFAVIVNIGKISQDKASAIVAVDASAAMMASLFASHAENLYQSIIWSTADHTIHEGAEEQIRPLTRQVNEDIWTYIAGLLIAIVGLVLACTGVFTFDGAVLIGIASVVLSAATLALQLTVVPTQNTNAWNRMFEDLDYQDQFREQGIQTLLSSSVQDQVMIDDVGDFDMDGTYKNDGSTEGVTEKVGRFSVLYTRRAEAVSTHGDVAPLPSAVIYAWRDKDNPDSKVPHSGKWHIIKAEVNVPTRCEGQCGRTSCEGASLPTCANDGTTQGCFEPFVPWVKAWHPDGSNRFYYSLIDGQQEDPADARGLCGICNDGALNNLYSHMNVTKCFKGGLVRAKLTRYDESGGALNWATGVNFWNMLFHRPNVLQTVSADSIESACGNIMQYGETSWPSIAESPEMGPGGGDVFEEKGCSHGVEGGIMLNCRSNYNTQCVALLENLLAQEGIQSQSCAEYFVRRYTGSEHYQTAAQVGYRNSRFGLKFVPCPSRPWPTNF